METIAILLLLLAVVIAGIAAWLVHRSWNRVIAHPIVLTLAMMGAIYVVPMRLAHHASDATLRLMNLSLVGLMLGCMLFYAIPRRRQCRYSPPRDAFHPKLINYVLFITLLITGIFFMCVLDRFSLREFASYYGKSKVGTAWVFILLTINYVIVLYMLLVERVRLWNPKIVAILALTLMTLVTRGQRGTYVFLGLIYMIWSLSRVRKFPFRLVSVGVLALLMMGIATYFRYNFDVDRLANYMTVGVFVDFDNVKNVNHLTENIDDIGLQYGMTIIDMLQFYVPRAIWPGKPVSHYANRIMYPDLYVSGRTTSFTIGLIGNSYLNFGSVGVLIAHILFAIALCSVYERLILHCDQGDQTSAYLCAVVLAYCCYLFVMSGILNKMIAHFLLVLGSFRLFIWGTRTASWVVAEVMTPGIADSDIPYDS